MKNYHQTESETKLIISRTALSNCVRRCPKIFVFHHIRYLQYKNPTNFKTTINYKLKRKDQQQKNDL